MKRVIKLTESDLARIVRRVINEGVIAISKPKSWVDIKNVELGDTMNFSKDGKVVHMKDGNPYNSYYNFGIVQNPKQVQLNQGGVFNVISFDPNRKQAKFNNGLVIGAV